MYGVVQLGTKEVEMVANAASPYFYRKIFQEDFLAKVQEKSPDADLLQKMGYVMAMQAEYDNNIQKLMKLTPETFYQWLLDFDAMDLIMATDKISKIYFQQTETTSSEKKRGE